MFLKILLVVFQDDVDDFCPFFKRYLGSLIFSSFLAVFKLSFFENIHKLFLEQWVKKNAFYKLSLPNSDSRIMQTFVITFFGGILTAALRL